MDIVENKNIWAYTKSIFSITKKWTIRNLWNPVLVFVIFSYISFLTASIDHIGFTFQQSEAFDSIFAKLLGRFIGTGVEVMLVVTAFAIVIKRSRNLFAILKEFRINKGKKVNKNKVNKAKLPELIISSDKSTWLLWGALVFFAFVNLFSNFYFYMYHFKMRLIEQGMLFPESIYPKYVITLTDIRHIDFFVMFTKVYSFSFFLPIVSLLLVEIIKFVIEQKAIKDMYLLMEEDEEERKANRNNNKNNTLFSNEKTEEKPTPKKTIDSSVTSKKKTQK